MKLNDYNHIRTFSVANSKHKWFREAKKLWDAGDMWGSRRILGSVDEVQKLFALKPRRTGRMTPVSHATATEVQIFFHPNQSPVCPICNKGELSFYKKWSSGCTRKCSAKAVVPDRKVTCLRKYGKENPSQVKSFQDKRTNTMIESFGVENAFQSKKLQKKAKATINALYGVDNVSQSTIIKKRKEDTSRKNFGKSHWTKAKSMKHKLRPFTPEMLEKAKATCLEKYGVPNVFLLPEYQERARQTILEKYGVDNIFKTPGFAYKAAEICFKKYGAYPWELSRGKCFIPKDYRDPVTGKMLRVQGHEDWALDWLYSRKTKVRCVVGSKNVPSIPYTLQGKRHRYYPDIVAYTISTKRIVEVKSDYILTLQWERNLAKFRAANKYCEKQGYEFWLFIYSHDKGFIRIKNPTAAKIRAFGIGV